MANLKQQMSIALEESCRAALETEMNRLSIAYTTTEIQRVDKLNFNIRVTFPFNANAPRYFTVKVSEAL